MLTPNKRMPFHGIRLPVNKCGNLIGKITASFNASFAPSKPATSDHLTCGFSITMAPSSLLCNFFFSGSSESDSSSPLFLSSLEELSPSLTGFFLLPFFKYSFNFSALSKYCKHLARIESLALSPCASSTQIKRNRRNKTIRYN